MSAASSLSEAANEPLPSVIRSAAATPDGNGSSAVSAPISAESRRSSAATSPASGEPATARARRSGRSSNFRAPGITRERTAAEPESPPRQRPRGAVPVPKRAASREGATGEARRRRRLLHRRAADSSERFRRPRGDRYASGHGGSAAVGSPATAGSQATGDFEAGRQRHSAALSSPFRGRYDVGQGALGVMEKAVERSRSASESDRPRAVESDTRARRVVRRPPIRRGHLAVRAGWPEYGGVLPEDRRVESRSVARVVSPSGEESSLRTRQSEVV